MMSDFDTLCDRTSPGRKATDDEIWDAVKALAQPGAVARAIEEAPLHPPPPSTCMECGGGGWTCYEDSRKWYGTYDPYFWVCTVCRNPEGNPRP